MNTAVWREPIPKGASIVNGIVFYREEEPFTSDLLSRHPDCLAEPMAKEYARLYAAQGEEQAEAYLSRISSQLNAAPLCISARDEEIIIFARKQAEQFIRLQRWFNNPAIAARFLCQLAHSKYGVTPPGGTGQAKLQS